MSALANIKIAKDKPLDGTNLIPYLNGEKKGIPHQNIFIRKYDSKLYSVRDGDLKLIVKSKGNRKELYNLKKDISESNNIAEFHPEEVERLYQILNEWESELIDPIFLGLIHTAAWIKKTNKKKK